MSPLQSTIIELNNIHYRYHQEDTREALAGVSLKVNRGEWLAIIFMELLDVMVLGNQH